MAEIRNISFSYSEYGNEWELESADLELVNSARNAARSAYAPYSGFMVGAAVRLESGKVVQGSNVENAAFPSGICAERTAMAAAISNYPDDRPVAVAIAALKNEEFTNEPVSPCGNCRQVIAEEETRTGRGIRIILSGREKIIVVDSISLLLPLQFSRDSISHDRP